MQIGCRLDPGITVVPHRGLAIPVASRPTRPSPSTNRHPYPRGALGTAPGGGGDGIAGGGLGTTGGLLGIAGGARSGGALGNGTMEGGGWTAPGVNVPAVVLRLNGLP